MKTQRQMANMIRNANDFWLANGLNLSDTVISKRVKQGVVFDVDSTGNMVETAASLINVVAPLRIVRGSKI